MNIIICVQDALGVRVFSFTQYVYNHEPNAQTSIGVPSGPPLRRILGMRYRDRQSHYSSGRGGAHHQADLQSETIRMD
jgi:hypothetical protein